MKNLLIALAGTVLFTACEKSEPVPGSQGVTSSQKVKKTNLNLAIQGLEPLGHAAKYEGWLIVNGSPVSTGKFVVNSNGGLAPSHFNVDKSMLSSAAMFVLTIEPNPDSDPAPSDVHILAGPFSGNTADLTVAHPAALGDDFSTASGKMILATPTTTTTSDENSGIWFLDLSTGSPMQGLNLPVLPAGWRYEGWTVINGIPVSSGTFLMTDVADDADPFSGPQPGPPFPGEDYVMNAPDGLTFPTDLSGGIGVISIEPYPDNSPAPFLLKPVVGQIPMNAVDHFTYSMSNNSGSFPSGSAIR